LFPCVKLTEHQRATIDFRKSKIIIDIYALKVQIY